MMNSLAEKSELLFTQKLKKEILSSTPTLPNDLANIIAGYVSGFEQSLNPIELGLLKARASMLENKKSGHAFFLKKRTNHNWYQIACALTMLEKMPHAEFLDFATKSVNAYESAHSKDLYHHRPTFNTECLLDNLRSSKKETRRIVTSIEEYLLDDSNSSSKLYNILLDQVKQVFQNYKITENTKDHQAQVTETLEELMKIERSAYDECIKIAFILEKEQQNEVTDLFVELAELRTTEQLSEAYCQKIPHLQLKLIDISILRPKVERLPLNMNRALINDYVHALGELEDVSRKIMRKIQENQAKPADESTSLISNPGKK